MNLRSQILAVDDRPTKKLHVPEWHMDVWVRTLSARERDDFEKNNLVRKGKYRESDLDNLRARLVIKCLVEEDGKRIFEDTDATALGEKGSPALDRIFDACRSQNRMYQDVDEDAEKNSAATIPACSPSG